MSELLTAALIYAERGWPVFPVRIYQGPDGRAVKQPLTKQGFKDASTDRDQLERWFGPDVGADRGIGIATGLPSGLVVLDVDPIHQGDATLSALVGDHGPIPLTTVARTGSGGWHYYFKRPDYVVSNSAGKLGLGLDIRADGGYVVVPPSPHPAGSYRWEASYTRAGLADLPAWIVEGNAKRPRTELARTEGSRNVALTSIAGTLRTMGLDEAQLYAALVQMDSGLPDEEVRSVAQSVARYEPKGYPRTEAGQAELLQALNRTRYVFDGRIWLEWKGHWWDDHQVEPGIWERAIEAARYRATVDDPEERKFASSMESKAHLSAVLDLASKKLTVDPETFDSDPLKLGVLNGVVEFSTGQLLTGDGVRSAGYISRHSNVDFHDDRSAPRWVRFIQEIFQDDKEVIEYVWKAIGYSFTGLTREQCWFLCYGRGANGKSTFLETLRSIAGTYGHTAKVSTFVTQRARSDADEDVASLRGKRFVISGEANHTAELDQERIKSLIGSESTRARFLYSGSFEFSPVFKLWIANNQRPRVTDDALGFWRRVRLIPFERKFSPKDEPGLKDTLRGESSGILNWIIEGARRYLDVGLETPTKIAALTDSYQQENDHFGQFLREAMILDESGQIESHAMYSAYRSWALDSGYTQNRIWAPHILARAAATKFETSREKGKTIYRGVMRPEEEQGVDY